ncbi:lipoyl synthase [Alkalibacter mobilis]|uniref:lipoyl synthase n=1 Tax=Alkalibacter mobilis TaxID=2787712 RepID=UPI00189FC520|nr:lipoyl synthase [Alkalibacter mobilis]MBF7097491.1 lipoyl synthase [Alkalibacter mobilis]
MTTTKKPDWLKIKINVAKSMEVTEMLRSLGLNTVCEEANCPNKVECFTKKTATFMILGSNCTRNCTFCNVEKHETTAVDPEEPANIAEAIEKMGMKHVVITSVTRDDLEDGGSNHFADVIRTIKDRNKGVTVEVLIPDFQGDHQALLNVIEARPEIINHNIETVPRLYPEVRPMATYERSLELLSNVKKENSKIITKSGIMLGLGETYDEVMEVFEDLRKVNCDVLTIGQYLAPSKEHHEVVEYVHPDKFEEYKEKALSMGFKYVASAPFVRSSYNAFEAMDTLK